MTDTKLQTKIAELEGKLDAQRLRTQRAEAELSSLRQEVSELMQDESLNPWKRALIDELIVDCILTKDLERDPILALRAAINWNVDVALDPKVSKAARDLINSYAPFA